MDYEKIELIEQALLIGYDQQQINEILFDDTVYNNIQSVITTSKMQPISTGNTILDKILPIYNNNPNSFDRIYQIENNQNMNFIAYRIIVDKLLTSESKVFILSHGFFEDSILLEYIQIYLYEHDKVSIILSKNDLIASLNIDNNIIRQSYEKCLSKLFLVNYNNLEDFTFKLKMMKYDLNLDDLLIIDSLNIFLHNTDFYFTSSFEIELQSQAEVIVNTGKKEVINEDIEEEFNFITVVNPNWKYSLKEESQSLNIKSLLFNLLKEKVIHVLMLNRNINDPSDPIFNQKSLVKRNKYSEYKIEYKNDEYKFTYNNNTLSPNKLKIYCNLIKKENNKITEEAFLHVVSSITSDLVNFNTVYFCSCLVLVDNKYQVLNSVISIGQNYEITLLNEFIEEFISPPDCQNKNKDENGNDILHNNIEDLSEEWDESEESEAEDELDEQELDFEDY